jgi:arylsulfatase A-like enzyme
MVEQHDYDLGRLVQATKDVGIYADTTFILTADHGMSNWTTSALQVLTDAVASTGYSYEVLYAGDHAAAGTQVIIDPAVRVSYLHLRGDAATAQGTQKVRDALAGHPEFTDVLGPSDLTALHASPALGDLVVEAQPPYSFAKPTAEPPPGSEKGAHGSQAELPVPLLLSGAGINRTVPSPAGLVDVAPTIAALLHAPCPGQAQGRALTEAFTAPAACTS